MEHEIILNEAKASKLKVDDGVGSFMVSFNVKHVRQHDQVSLDDINAVLGRLADVQISPLQKELPLDDGEPENKDMFEDED